MLQETAHKLDAFNQSRLVGSCISTLDTAAHLIAFDAEDAPVGDDAAAHVLAEVFDRVFTRSGAIHGDVPAHLHHRPELGLVDPSDIEQCIAQ